MQEWAGFWLREQQRYWQRWARSPVPPESLTPADLSTLAVQTWQHGCELWLSSIGSMLPATLVEPVTTVLKQSQDDIQRALQAAQSRTPEAEQRSRPDSEPGATPGPWPNPFLPIQERDLARLGNDPAWCEHIEACNGFVQFHIQSIVEILNTLKARLREHPGSDPGSLAQIQLPRIASAYQAKLQSPEYRQVLERLSNALAVLADQS